MNCKGKSKARATVIGALVVTVLTLGTGAALATAPTRVKIEVKTILTRADHPGKFTTSGAGLCRRGTSTDRVLTAPRQIGNQYRFHFRKTFTCADGSGTFAAVMEGRRVIGTPTWSGTWRIVGGTSAYSKLRGAGKLVGDELPGRVNDHLVGSAQFD